MFLENAWTHFAGGYNYPSAVLSYISLSERVGLGRKEFIPAHFNSSVSAGPGPCLVCVNCSGRYLCPGLCPGLCSETFSFLRLSSKLKSVSPKRSSQF